MTRPPDTGGLTHRPPSQWWRVQWGRKWTLESEKCRFKSSSDTGRGCGFNFVVLGFVIYKLGVCILPPRALEPSGS